MRNVRNVAILLAMLAAPALADEPGTCQSADLASAWTSSRDSCAEVNGIFTPLNPRIWTTRPTGTFATSIQPAQYLTIMCAGGSIKISMRTGKVELDGCDADDGARAFWAAIERQFPRQIPN